MPAICVISLFLCEILLRGCFPFSQTLKQSNLFWVVNTLQLTEFWILRRIQLSSVSSDTLIIFPAADGFSEVKRKCS